MSLDINKGERLNKFLAERLGISRREADALIVQKKVRVGDEIAELGRRVGAEERVFVRGEEVGTKHRFTYLKMNKPAGYVCSRKRQGETPTVFEILPEQYRTLKTVGRLDKDSSGLILFTDDGDFAYKMTHPKFLKYKVYEAQLDKDLEPFHQQLISEFGLQLEDGISKLGLTRVERASELNLARQESVEVRPGERRWFKVEMSEGRNRQIRRTFAALGYTVIKLHRVEFGDYALGELRFGEIEEIRRSPSAAA